MPEPTVADVGEDALVSAVLRTLTASGSRDPEPGPRVVVPPGDDAAVVADAGPVVVTTDTLVVGVDFRLDWSSAADVGRKTVVQVLADVEAMGARPTGLVVSLTAPGDLPLSWATGLAAGLGEGAAAAGAAVLGGDVAEGPVTVVTGTGLGVLDGPAPPVTRAGARPGDVVALLPLPGRPLGASAAGLAALSAGVGTLASPEAPADWDAGAREALTTCLAAHRAPVVDHRAGAVARAAGATSMIDVSDGLVRDVLRVAQASGVVVDLDGAALSPGDDLRALATALDPADRDLARRWVLTSGEEHAMLATFPAGALPPGAHVVGACREPAAGEQPGVLVDGADPAPLAGATGGWTHYGRRP
ncbi:thiamine-phosphate kinase [Aquipuribacter nitratireducens]|uniref:Thiamine-monophosphate kinase n=1 Tax=Aquipuribacter nitratireducens TaxID=650104 RepID=A0ABW0GMN7_9MICO